MNKMSIRDSVFWRCPTCNQHADEHGTYACKACWDKLSNDERVAIIYRLYPLLLEEEQRRQNP